MKQQPNPLKLLSEIFNVDKYNAEGHNCCNMENNDFTIEMDGDKPKNYLHDVYSSESGNLYRSIEIYIDRLVSNVRNKKIANKIKKATEQKVEVWKITHENNSELIEFVVVQDDKFLRVFPMEFPL